MDFGFFVPARVDVWPVVQRAEEVGFDHAWLFDSQMLYADVYSCMTLCAEHTRTIKLGPGVSNPSSRIAPLTASCLATVNQVAPGRVVFGIGTGNTTRRAMGFPAARLEEMADHIRVVRALLGGETVSYREGEREQHVQLINREGGFMNLRDKVPIVVSALGPKARELAAELGDEVMITGLPTTQDIKRLRDEMRPGAERAGRNVNDIPIVLMARVYVLEKGEQVGSERMRAVLGGLLAGTIGGYATGFRPRAGPTPDEAIPAAYRRVVAAYRERIGGRGGPAPWTHAYHGYLWELPKELCDLLPNEVLLDRTVVGTADEVLRQVREWAAMGVTQVSPMMAGGTENVRMMVERFGREVIARY